MIQESASWVGLVLADGRYRIIAKLGEGGMGFVYRARDLRLDCDVVIKVPRRAMLEDAGFAGRFSREIRSLVQLAHPHIVRLTDVGEHDGVPFAVMRVAADPANRRVPKSALDAMRPDGSADALAVLRASARRPAEVPHLLAIIRDVWLACCTLVRACRLLDARFGFMDDCSDSLSAVALLATAAAV